MVTTTSMGNIEQSLRTATICATKDQVSCDLDGEAVILHKSTGTYFGLNEVGCRVWTILQKPCTYDDIVSKVLEEFEVDPAQLEPDLDKLLLKMLDARLIQVSDVGNAQIPTS
jgi:hypothetical protein